MSNIESVLCLVDQLKSEDCNLRLHAINNIDLIATAIGVERTREELVPYMSELLEDENDEVLLALATKLGDLTQLVGGEQYTGVLLTPLQTLCTKEENVIRDKAVKSINRLAQLMSIETLNTELIKVVKFLAESEWFSARSSAAGLLCIPLSRSFTDDLVSYYIKLAKDDTPMVRRAAAATLGIIADICKNSTRYAEVSALYDLFFKDDHDSVRQMVLHSTEHECVDQDSIALVVRACARDRSWRIRYSVVEYLAVKGGDIAGFSKFVPELLSLQGDPEPEVRSVMLLKMPQFAAYLGKAQFVAKLFPVLENLTKDPSPYVKLSLVTAISEISGFLGSEETASQLVPLISQLTKDESFEVRFAFAESMQNLLQSLGADQVYGLVTPTLVSLMNDTQWRIRIKVVELLPQIASLIGKERFEAKLLRELPRWVEDSVCSIREAMFEAVLELARIFGNSWASGLMDPVLRTFSTHVVFTKRMTALVGAEKLVSVLGLRKTTELLLKMSADPVPNIKFCVAKAFKSFAGQLDGELKDRVVRAMEELGRDNDFDVRYYSEQTLTTLRSLSS
jgi:serine/threonine-protein phosphatase 2A regulatory subunit A